MIFIRNSIELIKMTSKILKLMSKLTSKFNKTMKFSTTNAAKCI